MAAKVKITGLPELIAKFNYLRQWDTLDTIAFRASFGAAKDLREGARANAVAATERHTGSLERGFAIKRMVEGTRRGYTVGVRFGPKALRFTENDPYYWWWLEFGTARFLPGVGLGFFRKAIIAWKPGATETVQRAGTKAVLDSGNRALAKFGSGK